MSLYLGEMTNNQAEYQALIRTLDRAFEVSATDLQIFCDSELIVRQIRGEYRVKHAELKPLFQQVMNRLQRVDRYTIDHIPREKNKRADELANLAIDRSLTTQVE